MKTWSQGFLTVFMAFFATSAFAKNVCTITINSSEEKEAFEKSLKPLGFNFIELTEKAKDDNSQDHWLTKACKKKIDCDILIVSGHFGGTFFGSSGYRLSMEDLEKNSCNEECSGILKKPKEVFLFGCNTLAGKEKDHRSPQEYLNVLLEDGFTRSQAEAIVAYRYSPLGQSFGDRMSRVFSGTPRIYGFNSVGPSGKNVKWMLDKYLSSSQQYYTQIDQVDTSTNSTFLESLKQTAAVQTKGSDATNSVCYLSSQRVSYLDKLLWVEKAFDSNNLLESIQGIQMVLEEANKTVTVLTPEEQAVLKRLQANEKAKSQMMSYLQEPRDFLITVQINLIKTLKNLSMITSQEYNSLIMRFAWGDLSQPFTLEKRDLICSLNMQMELPGSFPVERFQENHFLDALDCARPQNEQAQLSLANALVSGATLDKLYRIVSFLWNLKPTSERVHLAIARSLKDDDPNLKLYVIELLREINSANEDVHLALAEAMKDGGLFISLAAAEAIEKSNCMNEKVVLAWAEALNAGQREVGAKAMSALSKIESPNEQVQLALVKAVRNGGNTLSYYPYIRTVALSKLMDLKPKSPNVLLAIREALATALRKNDKELAASLQELFSTHQAH